jgi:hypothetical protein
VRATTSTTLAGVGRDCFNASSDNSDTGTLIWRPESTTPRTPPPVGARLGQKHGDAGLRLNSTAEGWLIIPTVHVKMLVRGYPEYCAHQCDSCRAEAPQPALSTRVATISILYERDHAGNTTLRRRFKLPQAAKPTTANRKDKRAESRWHQTWDECDMMDHCTGCT